MMTNNEYTASIEYYGEPKVYILEQDHVCDDDCFEDQYDDEDEMATWYEFDAYQDFTDTTAIYPEDKALEYVALGLASEAGEFAGKIKKMIRDNNHDQDAMIAELGDVLWYVAQAASTLGVHLSDVAIDNVAKLKSRQERGTLKGNGDDR
jgi:NTP pyrophosphatase (non-canonical NTP hydrolase)